MRRLGIDHGDELDRNAIIGLGKDHCGCIGKTELRGTGGDLLDGIRRALAAYDFNVHPGGLVVALVESDVVVRVPAIEAEICDKRDRIVG